MKQTTQKTNGSKKTAKIAVDAGDPPPPETDAQRLRRLVFMALGVTGTDDEPLFGVLDGLKEEAYAIAMYPDGDADAVHRLAYRLDALAEIVRIEGIGSDPVLVAAQAKNAAAARTVTQ